MIHIGFDIVGLDQNAKEDQEGIEKSSKFCERVFFCYNLFYISISLVNNLIEEEIKNGISSERIVSVIFSYEIHYITFYTVLF
jgi:hypothetical protein